MRRITLGFLLALSVGCGNSTHEAGPSALVVEVAAERTFDGRSLGRTGGSLALVGSGQEAVLAWSRVEDNQRSEIVAQRFNSSLDEADELERISGPVPKWLTEPSLCGDDHGLSAAWSGGTGSLPEGITTDTGYVEASLDRNDAARLRVQDDLTGEETGSALACAPDGSRAMTWGHRCYAIEKHDDYFITFEPEQCKTEPSDGLYMQVFERDGMPVAAPRKLSDSGQGDVAAIAAAGRDRFIVITPGAIQLRNRSGDLLDQAPIGSQLHERHSSVACLGTRCAAAFGWGTVQLWTFDANDLEHALKTVIREREDTAPGEAEYGASPHVACDETSGCVVTWVLMHGVIVDEYFGYDESLVIYARAFDLEGGRMGEDESIAGGENLDDGALIASIGAGSFVTARLGISDITMQHLQVK